MGIEVLTVDKYYITVCAIPFFHQGRAEYIAVMTQNRDFSAEIHKMFHLLADLGERENAIAADKAQIYRKFMLGFISGKITQEEIQGFKKFRGTEETVYTGVILIHSKDTMAVYYKLTETFKKARLMKKGKANSYIVENAAKQEAVILLELRTKGDDETAKEWQRMFFEDIEYSIEGVQEGTVSMGRLYPELDNIMTGYWEAKEAYIIGQALLEDSRCFLYSVLSPYSALRNADLSQIDLSYVEILGNHQKGLAFDGISTLEAYIECGGYKKAAEKLYIHENTLRYRIQKIAGFLHLDLSNPIIAHALIVQIKLWRLTKM
jgi:sugar diacid utilization regulator